MAVRDIFEFAGNEGQKRVRIREQFGEAASSWANVRTYDDVIIPEERALVYEVGQMNLGNPRCPFLKQKGKYFNYCELIIKEMKGIGHQTSASGRPNPCDAVYLAHIDPGFWQLFCLQDKSGYENCIHFRLDAGPPSEKSKKK